MRERQELAWRERTDPEGQERTCWGAGSTSILTEMIVTHLITHISPNKACIILYVKYNLIKE